MTGLEKILQKIQQETQREEDAILQRAGQECQKIREKEQADTQSACRALEEQEQKQCALLISTSKSSAHKEGKNLLLRTRRQLIEQAFSSALEALRTLEEPDYFSLLATIVSHNALPRQGELILSQVDAGRCPTDFLSQCVLPEGAGLALSEEHRELGGGLVLRYQDLEINCSFSELLSANRELIEDRVNQLLFNTEEQGGGELR